MWSAFSYEHFSTVPQTVSSVRIIKKKSAEGRKRAKRYWRERIVETARPASCIYYSGNCRRGGTKRRSREKSPRPKNPICWRKTRPTHCQPPRKWGKKKRPQKWDTQKDLTQASTNFFFVSLHNLFFFSPANEYCPVCRGVIKTQRRCANVLRITPDHQPERVETDV